MWRWSSMITHGAGSTQMGGRKLQTMGRMAGLVTLPNSGFLLENGNNGEDQTVMGSIREAWDVFEKL